MAVPYLPAAFGRMTTGWSALAGVRRPTLALCWMVLGAELLIALCLRMGDQHVVPTLLSYGPRWIFLVPVIAMLPAVLLRRQAIVPLIAAGVVVVGPIMQFEVGRSQARSGSAQTISVISLNAGRHARMPPLAEFATAAGADLVAIQECRSEAAVRAFRGWTVRSGGSLCTASRYPITSHELLDRSLIGGYHSMMLATTVETPHGPVSFFNVHLETVREGIEAIVDRGGAGFDGLRANLEFRDLESRVLTSRVARAAGSIIVAGDFNMPDDSVIYRARWGRWPNAFAAVGNGFGYTKYTRWWGIRIDHVLYSEDWRAIEAGPGRHLGSDHRPMVAVLERTGPAPAALAGGRLPQDP